MGAHPSQVVKCYGQPPCEMSSLKNIRDGEWSSNVIWPTPLISGQQLSIDPKLLSNGGSNET
jgi:hypothetical protein